MVDIAKLQVQVGTVDARLEKIETNHLPHLQAGIDRVEEKQDQHGLRLAYWGGGIAVLTFIVPIILFIIGKVWN